ncbi:hypothetical protein AAFX91_15015 [Bradyrhizobium sp. 31Argb]|uniref:hypothetical protein n=1 Tax=Bradyrhizobium sp. 31Argb TaxID=3141247 RepID=UPI003749742C
MFVWLRILGRARLPAFGTGVLCWFVAGCSQVQMGYNVLSFDAAIADTANQQLLLNAVRASQHYPKSFTQPGELKASPPVSGGIESTLNLTRLDGLKDYSVTPKLSVDGGYSEFSLKNLNFEEYMFNIRAEIPDQITDTFERNPNWPAQLRDLLYVQKSELPEQVVGLIDSRRKSICQKPPTDRENRRCEKLREQIEEYTSQCGGDLHFIDVAVRLHQFRNDRNLYYSTASNYCHYNRFRIFLEEVRLTKLRTCSTQHLGCIREVRRSALDMIGFLGELIAAENYISAPFIPRVMIGAPVGSHFEFVDVPLFEVRVGAPTVPVSVLVVHEGVAYYIPRPDFGSANEARSMQTLDLVLQTVQAATKREDVPKSSPTVGVIPVKRS